MLRNIGTFFLITILLFSFSTCSISWASYDNFTETVLPLNALTIIEKNENSLWDEFAMLSLLPYVVFHENNAVYVSPIIYDCNDLPTQYLLEDWLNYCSQYGGLDTLLTVGDVSHVPSVMANHVVSFKLEDPLTFSLDVAERLWIYSDKAVIALINETISNGSSSEIMFSGSLASPVMEWVEAALAFSSLTSGEGMRREALSNVLMRTLMDLSIQKTMKDTITTVAYIVSMLQ